MKLKPIARWPLTVLLEDVFFCHRELFNQLCLLKILFLINNKLFKSAQNSEKLCGGNLSQFCVLTKLLSYYFHARLLETNGAACPYI